LNIYIKSINHVEGAPLLVPSKSYLHRALIASALCESETKLINSYVSNDIESTLNLVSALGSSVKFDENEITVYPNKVEIKKSSKINFYESGTSLRIGLPILASFGNDYEIIGENRLLSRPLDQFERIFNDSDMIFNNKGNQIVMKGKLKGNKFIIDSSKSSQFLSGMLMASPLLSKHVELINQSTVESIGYVNITIDVLKKFGISIIKTQNGYSVNNGKYRSPKQYSIENDFSQAAFLMVLAALKGKIIFSNLNLNSSQGDIEIINILKNMRANIIIENENFIIEKSVLNGIEIDARNIPDLIPILVVAASFSEGMTIIKNVDRLRFKESDRLKAILTEFTKFNKGITYENGDLRVWKDLSFEVKVFNSHKDHRIAMSLAIASIVIDGEFIIEGFECINKSYPNFLEDLGRVGCEYIEL
jgi:3-phosphoshikimate 1-carboxyvinyltransferase